MMPTSVRLAVVLIAAALCLHWIGDHQPFWAAMSGGLALVLLYDQFRHGRIRAGIGLMNDGLYDEARVAFAGALRWVGWRGPAAAVEAHRNLAMLDLRERDLQGATEHLRLAGLYRQTRGQQQWLETLSAGVKIEQGLIDTAVERLRRVVAQMPPDRTMTWVQSYLALAHLKQGKASEALSIVEMAVPLAKKDANRQTRILVFSAAAKANDALGNKKQAEEMIRLGVESGMLRSGDPEAVALAEKYGFARAKDEG